MLGRTFTDDDSTEEASSGQEPEYSFAGYNIEFSEKIALTPAAAQAKGEGAAAPSNNGRT
jgi:hypothetical protein